MGEVDLIMMMIEEEVYMLCLFWGRGKGGRVVVWGGPGVV